MTLPFSRLFYRSADEEPDRTIACAVEEMRRKTEAHIGRWHMDQSRWAIDMGAGTITFTNPRDRKVVAPVQVIGTFYTRDRTWLWRWDHPWVEPTRARHAGLARRFGERYQLARFTTRKIESSEDEAWLLTCVACHLAKANGGYRAPSDETMVFVTFGDIAVR